MNALFTSLLLQVRLPDGGPLYTETDLGQFIAEPFNAVSAFFFLLIVGYWVGTLRKTWRDHLFIAAALPVLLIGGIGGTGYHAFRMSQTLLVMDWLPIMLLCLAASIYFLVQLRIKWWGLIAGIAGIFLLSWLGALWAPPHLRININYGVMALTVVSPILVYLIRTGFREGRYVGLAFGAFLLAITFRIADPFALLPMGTHFLWHTFGALACHFTIMYVYRERLTRKVNELRPA